MPDVGETDADAVVDLYQLAVAAGAEAAHDARNVVKVVQRLDLRAAAAQRFARFPLCVRHLDVRAVAQHDVAERGRRRACVHRAAEALLVQQRQVAGVVYVRVGQQDEINAAGADGQLLVHENVLALLHAAVDTAALVADLDESAAAGDFVRRAQECYLHIIRLRIEFVGFIIVFYTIKNFIAMCMTEVLHKRHKIVCAGGGFGAYFLLHSARVDTLAPEGSPVLRECH